MNFLAKARYWALCFCCLLFSVSKIQAQYAASDVLGQYDINGDSTFTQGIANGSRPSPNNYGFASTTYAVEDSTRHHLFVADTGNHRILVRNLNAGDNSLNLDQPADHVLGQANFISNSSGTTQSTLSSPKYLDLDETGGRLFVADTGNRRVLVFDVSGTITNGMTASNVIGQVGFVTNTASRTQAGLFSLAGLTYDGTDDDLYVVDSLAHRVLVYDGSNISNGMSASNVLGQGNFTAGLSGLTNAKLNAPLEVEIDESGNRLFVSDFTNNRVMVFNVATIVNGEAAVNVLGQSLFTTNTAAVSQSTVHFPDGLAYDSTNDLLYVVQEYEDRVVVFDTSSVSDGMNASNVLGRSDFTTPATPQVVSGAAAPAANALAQPRSAALLSNNLLAIGDYTRLALFDVTTIVDGEDVNDVLGQTDENGNTHTTTIYANAALPAATSLNSPGQALIDTINNKLYVADYANKRVLIYNLDATTKALSDKTADYVLGVADFVTKGTGSPTNKDFSPIGLALDKGNSYLFVADYANSRVLVFDVATIVNYEAAIHVIGEPDFTTYSTDTTDSLFNEVGMIAYDDQDDWLFVSDIYNYRVMIFDLSAGITDSMAASKVLGQDDFVTGTDVSPTQDSFSSLEGGITYDSNTRQLFVADPYNSRVLVFAIPSTLSSLTNGVNADYVLGQSNFTSTGTNNTQSGFEFPVGLAVGNSRDLYVWDCYHRIVVYDTSSIANGENASAVIGQANFTNTSTGTSQTAMSCSWLGSVAIDPSYNRLYVSDDDNSRLLIFDLPYISTNSLPNGDLNSSYGQTINTANIGGTISYSLTSGSIPGGLIRSNNNIYGFPTQAGTKSFVFRIDDDQGVIGNFFNFKTFSIQINGPSSGGSSSSSTSTSSTSNSGSSSSSSSESTSNSTPSVPIISLPLLEEEIPIVTENIEAVEETTALVVEQFSDRLEQIGGNLARAWETASSIVTENKAIRQLAAAATAAAKEVAPISAAASVAVVPSMAAAYILLVTPQFSQNISLNLFWKILQILGIMPSRKPAGLVYDSFSKKPVAFALVTFTGQTAQSFSSIKETAVTDQYGVFQGVKLPPGDYWASVSHQDYKFPTQKARPPYLSIKEFYKADKFGVKSEYDQQTLIVPLDLLQKKKELDKTIWKNIKFFVSSNLFRHFHYFMFVISLILTILTPSVINLFILSIYLLLFFTKQIRILLNTKLTGKIVNNFGKALGNVIIKISEESGLVLALASSDIHGNFKIYLPKKKYQIEFSREGHYWAGEARPMTLPEVDLSRGSEKINVKMKKRYL